MNTPTISEVARRAAWKAYATAMNRMTDGLNYDADKPPHEESIAMKEALQAALDSAHPAPKEGETPETARHAFTTAGGTVVVAAGFARSLELRLSEAKREIEELKARLDCSSYDSGRANP